MQLLIFIACFLVTLVRGQFLRDDNFEQFVPRSQVEDKYSGCNAFRFVVVSQEVLGVPTDIVDRSKYAVYSHGRGTEFDCPEGTLYSLLPNLCICSVVIPNHDRFNQDRCVTISGNFQESPFFVKEQGSGGSMVTGITYIEGSENVPFSNSDNCRASNVNQSFTMPFFDTNSFSRSSFDVQIQFSITDQTIGDSVYNIFSNAPCQFETDDASIIVSYLRNSNRGSIVMGLAIRNGWEVRGNQEVSLTYSCPINTFTVGTRTFSFNENDPTNTVRVVGTLANPAGIQLFVWNAELQALGLGTQGVPLTGFCRIPSIESTFGLRRIRGQYIIAERNCDPSFGEAPSNGRMCIGEMRITRDC